MRKNFLFVSALPLAAILSIGALAGAASAPVSEIRATAAASGSLPFYFSKRARMGMGGAGRFARKGWPYGGKNRAQRHALNVAFFG